VTATVDPHLGSRGQASFIVPKGTKASRKDRSTKKHGIRASHTAEVVLDECRVPGRLLLGGKEKLDAKIAKAREGAHTGAKQPAMATFEATRPSVAAQAIGIARAAYEESARLREGPRRVRKPITRTRRSPSCLADMITEIDAARLLVWRAAWSPATAVTPTPKVSQSKLKAGRVAVWVNRARHPDPRRLRVHP